ncbi:hypothetical protein [Balneatrix alpica]|uniref:hypothetical protein n=1 Tax=Balneatrix alpica TaxID=75684 RepID=UPI002739F59E|nr:hypothetical protein [Balneatrix alpica]
MTDDLPLKLQWQLCGYRIRFAEQPNNPQLFKDYLQLGEQLRQQPGCQSWQLYEAETLLLMEAAIDLCLPNYWRAQCLDWVAKPLLRLAANSSQPDEHQAFIRLQHQVSRLSHYFCPAWLDQTGEKYEYHPH